MDELKQDGIDLDGREELAAAIHRTCDITGPDVVKAVDAILATGWRSPAVVAGLVAEVESLTSGVNRPKGQHGEARAELASWQAATFEREADKNAAEGRARIAEHKLEEANRRLGAVAAELNRSFSMSAVNTDPHGAWREAVAYVKDAIRAVLGPVSGAVEGAGRDRESLAWVLLLGKWGGEDAREHLEDMVAKYADTYEPWQEALRAADMVIAANWSPSPVAGHEQEVRADHEHAAGLWCDECPDADVKRVERLLEDHEYVAHHECRCGWVNPLDGTEMAHRKHVAAVITARASGSSAPVQGGAES